ncbi:MAG: HAMP domain-containing sensor histidine kinase [Saprospiraceae bacterium]|jgi:two-component system phosphate regulon sensor histidine kinase PhoR|nr:HAMP domain-containing histidine kinase [Saprospiraceae bacterium]
MQYFYLQANYNKEEVEFNRSVNIALKSTAEYLAKKQNSEKSVRDKKGLIKREASNLYQVNMELPIVTEYLKYSLETEFDKQNIHTPFEVGIYNCGTNDLIYYEFNSLALDTATKKPEPKKVRNQKKDLNHYFTVKFPDKESFIYQEMSSVIVFSILLIIACLIFAGAIFLALRQKRYSEMMRDFVNNMTHEFKTPISSIKISSEVLLHHPLVEDDARLFQYAKIIKDQNQRLNDQVEKVLQIAKMESSTFTLRKEELSLHSIIQELLPSYEMRAHQLNGQIHKNLKASKDTFKGDKFHFTNVVSNLLDNAIKYSKLIPTIEIDTFNQGKTLVLEIKDQGIGIKGEELAKLFEKFYRVSTGDVHNVKGFGIGLYYVKRICDAHGFEVIIESEYTKGTKVRILLKN